MVIGKKNKDSSYYPLRWKIADSVENIIILHRTQAAIALAVLGLLFVVAGLFILGWGPGGDDDAETAQTAETELNEDEDDDQDDAENTDDGTDGDDGADRPEASPEQLLTTSSGTVVEITADSARLIGGFPSEEEADESFEIIADFFGAFDVVDDQVVNDAFSETDSLVIRIVDPLLFAEGTPEINPNFFDVFDAVSNFVFINGDRTIEVRAHVDGQELSDERAEAIVDQLVIALVEPDIISASGFGAGDLAAGETSRVDLILE